MGDAENSLPPSKKRAAGRELSRDNPGLDDEEEFSEQETKTFKRASEEVLANRRIVKVRRNQTSSAPSSNPFAAVRLVPPTDSSATLSTGNNVQEIEKTASEKVEPEDSEKEKAEKRENGSSQQPKSKVDEASEVRKPESTDAETEAKEVAENKGKVDDASEVTKPKSTDAETDAKEVTETKGKVYEASEVRKPISTDAEIEAKEVTETKGKVDEASEVRKPESTDAETEAKEVAENKGKVDEASEVRKPESTDAEIEAKKVTESKEVENDEKNDEAGGNVEKNTEPASVTSFQQVSSTQNAFTGLVGKGFPNSLFSFGSLTKSEPPIFPSFNFGTNGASVGDKTEGSKKPSMQEIPVETGEENEMAVFAADSTLFEFLDGGWKGRGKGELKVNVSTTGTGKARLVMRARGNYRLILNASLFPDMKLTNMEKKGITFACLNSAGEGKDGLSTFALKFKDSSIAEEFRAVVTEHKGSTMPAQTLKTPENSPKDE